MIIDKTVMEKLHQESETGINFYIVQALLGLLAILDSGEAMPLYSLKPEFYNIDDLLDGSIVPTETSEPQKLKLKDEKPYLSRFDALLALKNEKVNSAYTGTSGAFPLIKSYQLPTHTIFKRYLRSNKDPRFTVQGELIAGTYLTSDLDAKHADSGFGAVGRYALPIPLPARYVIDYELPSGTSIEVGTVAPNFGQSGGGVEIRLQQNTLVKQLKITQLSDY